VHRLPHATALAALAQICALVESAGFRVERIVPAPLASNLIDAVPA
jgi:hypothetical protein